MEIIIGIAITIIRSCVVVEVIMSAKVNLSAGCCYALPESIPLTRMVIETVCVKEFECRFMAKNEDVGLGICS